MKKIYLFLCLLLVTLSINADSPIKQALLTNTSTEDIPDGIIKCMLEAGTSILIDSKIEKGKVFLLDKGVPGATFNKIISFSVKDKEDVFQEINLLNPTRSITIKIQNAQGGDEEKNIIFTIRSENNDIYALQISSVMGGTNLNQLVIYNPTKIEFDIEEIIYNNGDNQKPTVDQKHIASFEMKTIPLTSTLNIVTIRINNLICNTSINLKIKDLDNLGELRGNTQYAIGVEISNSGTKENE